MSKLLWFTQALVEASLALLILQITLLLGQYVQWHQFFE